MPDSKKNFSDIPSSIKTVTLSIASPDMTLKRSSGEVSSPTTVNHRTGKPDIDGLSSERIFGPNEDWKCGCGNYKGPKYQYNVCRRCGVEVNKRSVRRNRMGHIKLRAPIVHPYYYKNPPNIIGTLLGISSKNLEAIIYHNAHTVTKPGIKAEEGMCIGDVIQERDYQVIMDNLPKDHMDLPDNHPDKFITNIGAEAIEQLLKQLDLDKLAIDLRSMLAECGSQQKRNHILKRLRMVEGFREGQKRAPNKPEWMVMSYLPVISPELRPVLPLESGHFATSDTTTWYRKVITRNHRLDEAIKSNAPTSIIRQEKRLLQETVSHLLDGPSRGHRIAPESTRTPKSLSKTLSGKSGRFRSNLLGKRVDYSGRSVTVGGPNLKMDECGIPKTMALELFKPHVMHGLLKSNLASTAKDAKKLIESKEPIIWSILDKAIENRLVLINRAPTLHRSGVQACYLKLIEGKAIRLHPLLCTALNADFDGDQLPVFVPLSIEANIEADKLMRPSNNILNPANGNPIIKLTKDMVLGIYYLTHGRKSTPTHPVKGEGMCFVNIEEVTVALATGCLDKHAYIKVRVPSCNEDGTITIKLTDTVAGRVVFNCYLPKELGFYNELMTSKKLELVIATAHKKVGNLRTAKLLDNLKELGFRCCYEGGITSSLGDIKTPDNKATILAEAEKKVDEITKYYTAGYITSKERHNQIIDIWSHATAQISSSLEKRMRQDKDGFNPFYMMKESGARGSNDQIRQLGGMRGLMTGSQQKGQDGRDTDIIQTPIKASFVEGLQPVHYFNSSRSGRKGLADTALQTAKAGYLSRKLVNTVQEIIITVSDCNTCHGITVTAIYNGDLLVDPLANQIKGRAAFETINHPITGVPIVLTNELIQEEQAQVIEEAGIESIRIRSMLTCQAQFGICAKCYGLNLATQREVHVGEAIGIVAAQSVSEQGTQLTLRSFHSGGAVSSTVTDASIKTSKPGILQFNNIRTVLVKNNNGEEVATVVSKMGEIRILDPETQQEKATYYLPYGASLVVNNTQQVSKGQELCHWDSYNRPIISEISGRALFQHIKAGVTYKEEYDSQTGHTEKIIINSKERGEVPTILVKSTDDRQESYILPTKAHLVVKEGDEIKPGQIIAKVPRVVNQSTHITSGLKVVSRTFETTEPINAASVAVISGVVGYGGIKRNAREIIVHAKDGSQEKHLVPLAKQLAVQDGDPVKAGTLLSEGTISIAKILETQGVVATASHITNTIQGVYRTQGININSKHLEPFIKQMMRRVTIQKSGDTLYLPQQLVDKKVFMATNKALRDKKVITAVGDTTFSLGQVVPTAIFNNENDRIAKQGLQAAEARDAKPAIASPKIQGITRSTLEKDSPIAAAAFQETPRRLADAAFYASVDKLEGIIERIALGLMIPAGTGRSIYNDILVTSTEECRVMA